MVTRRRSTARSTSCASASTRLGVVRAGDPARGPNQISVALPGRRQRRARRPAGRPDRPAVLLRLGAERPRPGLQARAERAPRSTGGAAAGTAGALSQYDAVQRAAQCPEQQRRQQHDATATPTTCVDDEDQAGRRRPRGRPRPTSSPTATRRQAGRTQRSSTVKPGTVVVQARAARQRRPHGRQAAPTSGTSCGTTSRSRARTSRTRSRTSTRAPAAAGSRSSRSTSPTRAAQIWQDTTRRSPSAARTLNPALGVTADAARQHFAIVLDNQLISVPYIDFQQNPDGIDGRNGSQIAGGFTIQSAQDLANLLKTGALPVALELISQSQVSATLGQQALDQGLVAGVAASLVVALFLLIFYRVLGLIAVWRSPSTRSSSSRSIKLIPITLTLPGIAGLILTIGVAADANIVIFERVKEEVRAGQIRSPRPSPGLQQGPDGDHRRERRDASSSRSSSSCSRPPASRASPSRSASAPWCRSSRRSSSPRRSSGTIGRSRLLAGPSALGAGQARSTSGRSTSWARRSGSSPCPA